MGRLQHGSSLGNHILVFSREFLAAKTDVRRSVKPGQPRSATLWNNLAGHASASGRACPTLVVRSDAVALTATALAVLEALLWGFHNARSGLAVICRNRKTKTARIAIRAVSFAGGVGLEPKTHRVHCASQARARARYLADVTLRNIIWGSACGVSRWGSACGVSRWGSACGVSRLLRLAPSLW